MSKPCIRKLTPHRLDLSPAQHRACEHFKGKSLPLAKPSTIYTYLRLYRQFLFESGHHKEHFNPAAPEAIHLNLWRNFVKKTQETRNERAIKRLPYIRDVLNAFYRDSPIPKSECPRIERSGAKRAPVVTVPKENLPWEADREFVTFLEHSARRHHGDDYRRFTGLVAMNAPKLLELPIADRFDQKRLQPLLDCILAPLTSYEQYQRLHLIGDGLNEWMKCNRFSWLTKEIAARRLHFKPVNLSRFSKTPKPSSSKTLLSIGDMKQDPYRLLLDKAFPTKASVRDRASVAKIVRLRSRLLFENDFLNLLNARIAAKIGTPNDEPSRLFSEDSIKALEEFLESRAKKRTIAKTVVRLRSMFTRLGKRDARQFEHLKMVSRRNFKEDPPKYRSTDDIDRDKVIDELRNNLARISDIIQKENGNIKLSDFVEFRETLVMAFLAVTGYRISNIANLRASQLDTRIN